MKPAYFFDCILHMEREEIEHGSMFSFCFFCSFQFIPGLILYFPQENLRYIAWKSPN